jgi:hypothetical protein
MEDTLTMTPLRRARIPGSTARVRATAPKKLTSNSLR